MNMPRWNHIGTKYFYVFTKPATIRQSKLQPASKPLPYPVNLYLSKSEFLVTVTATNKELSSVISALYLDGYKFFSWTIQIITLVL